MQQNEIVTYANNKNIEDYRDDKPIIESVSTSNLQRNWINEYNSEISITNDNGQIDHAKCQIEFVVGSYNVLAQNLLEENSYLYENCSDEFLTWEFRQENILNELFIGDADIYCLQEITEEHYDSFFKSKMETKGYNSIFKKRTGNNEDGCATFWKSITFNLVKHTLLEYKVAGEKNLNKNNIGIVVLLETLQENKSFICVGNTHLLFNPKRGDIKLAQLTMLIAEMNLLSTQANNCPVLLCCDLNSLPNSDIYKFVNGAVLNLDTVDLTFLSGQKEFKNAKAVGRSFISKNLKISDKCTYIDDHNYSHHIYTFDSGELKHELNFKSVYKHFQVLPDQTKIAEATSCHIESFETVDYIFYTVDDEKTSNLNESGVSKCSLKLLSYLELPTSVDMKNLGNLPNENLSSDHVILMAKFLLKLN